ncbi:hypothetical protein [Actinomadura sp. CNU-125]|uniref:hypothetical protein n=1 Tax=Actinomadura sp. CNU-125 TaxID=1904961 RepID=UPI0021CCD033|nr:hypothetical protein [Actinomadura sp. CNU-125]
MAPPDGPAARRPAALHQLLITPTGLRHTEPARDAFLTELLVRQIRHTSIVAFARNVVTGASGPVGYGFEAGGGTALPAVLDRPPLSAPRYLLTWRPDPAVGEAATYVAEVQDYYAAPRTLVENLPPATTTFGPLSARPVTAPVADGTRTARIDVTHDGTTAHVDLGQALRGHRFAQREDPAAGDASGTADIWSALRARRDWCGRRPATSPWTPLVRTTSSCWPCSAGSTQRTSPCAPPAVPLPGRPRTAPARAAW